MAVHEFAFVVDANPQADDFEDRFIEAGCDDATFLLIKGASVLSFDREAETYKEAVLSAYQQIKSTGSPILRFEPDFLVSPTEIADRSGLTRSSINLYIKGDRRSGFPSPHIRLKSANPLWDWVEVSHWLVGQDLIAQEAHQQALISRIINSGVQLKGAVPDCDFERALNQIAIS